MWCELARTGAVKTTPSESCAFSDCTIQTLQRPLTASGPLMFFPPAGGGRTALLPQPKSAAPPRSNSDGVPYQTMFTRPSSPALIHAKTLLCKTPSGEPEVSIVIGALQVFPWSVE